MDLRSMLTVNFGALSRFGILSLLLISLVFAGTPSAATKITGLVCTIYKILTSVFPIIVFTLFVLAAVAYGFGQFFGADTRAKAATWAMACLTGAIIMLIIYLLGPTIIGSLYQQVDMTTACP